MSVYRTLKVEYRRKLFAKHAMGAFRFDRDVES